ncbi:MAG TPA: DUF2474 family protein [Steroidobacteraceae bacterium]|nr:DUF2474 family protein [Steroidobacteraceae bacterium]
MSAKLTPRESPPAAWAKRLLWMAAIWTASVLALGVVAAAIRWVIGP